MRLIHALHSVLAPARRLVKRALFGHTLGVRVLGVDAAGRVALVRHTYVPGWYLPGGGIDRNELASEAARREFEEETGARLPSPPQLIGVFANFDEFPNNHILLFRGDDVAPVPRAGDLEIAEVGWFAPDALPADATPATRARLAEVLDGEAASPYWRERG